MTADIIQFSQSLKKGLAVTGKMLLRILAIILGIYLAFFCYVAVHEWLGHILTDVLVYARHGTYIDALEVRVQWLAIALKDGHWTIALAPFQFGGVTWASSHDLYPFTDWETGFSNLMGCGITALASLTVLAVLNLRKNIRHSPWFAGAFVLFVMIFDQILYTFTGPYPEPLASAVLMGINPLLFKVLVIGLVLVEAWLLIRTILRTRRSRRASASPA